MLQCWWQVVATGQPQYELRRWRQFWRWRRRWLVRCTLRLFWSVSFRHRHLPAYKFLTFLFLFRDYSILYRQQNHGVALRRMVCLFTSQFARPLPNYAAWWQRCFKNRELNWRWTCSETRLYEFPFCSAVCWSLQWCRSPVFPFFGQFSHPSILLLFIILSLFWPVENSWWLKCYKSYKDLFGWRRGSVVRTSICSRWTFPDLRLIHGWRVTTLWVRRP